MLAPTVDSDKTDTEGHLPLCEQDEVALSSLGVTAPQAMKSPIAADHHGVPFSLISDTVCTEEELSGQSSTRGTTSQRSSTAYFEGTQNISCHKRIPQGLRRNW